MTLDEYQKEAEVLFAEMKRRLISLLTKGVESNLNPDLMVAIVNIEIEKLQAE